MIERAADLVGCTVAPGFDYDDFSFLADEQA
jgi:predicted cupin superfamily sugar epimerase